MDFSFTGEQTQLRDALRRYLSQEYTFDARRKIIHGAGTSDTAWAGMAELGLMGVPVPEPYGGFSGTGVDMLVVMEELGRGIVVEPYFATAVLGAAFIKHGGSDAHKAALLSKVADGSLKLACALTEKQSRHELHNIILAGVASGNEARRSAAPGNDARRSAAPGNDARRSAAPDNGFSLNGVKTVVLHGAQAGMLIVSARTAGAARDKSGITVFIVDATAAGVSIKDCRTIDGMRAADISFTNVAVGKDAVLGKVGEGYALIERAAQVGIAALCAEAVGCMEAINAQTIEYLKTRKQFGVPIGKFQVLQHRAAEMFMEVEQARSLAYLAAVKVDSADASERARAIHAAKVRAGRAIKFVGQAAIQMHGGMGMTDELPVSHYFKRATMIDFALGDVDHHLAAFAALDSDTERAAAKAAAAVA